MRILGKTLVGASVLSTGMFGVLVSMLFLSIANEESSFAAVPTSVVLGSAAAARATRRT